LPNLHVLSQKLVLYCREMKIKITMQSQRYNQSNILLKTRYGIYSIAYFILCFSNNFLIYTENFSSSPSKIVINQEEIRIKVLNAPISIQPHRSSIIQLWVNPSNLESQVSLAAPDHWKVDENFKLRSSDVGYIQTIRIQAPEDAIYGDYSLNIKVEQGNEPRQSLEVPLRVAKIEKISIKLEEAPAFMLESQTYEFSIVVENIGNVELSLIPANIPGLKEEDEKKFTLKPKEAARLPVKIKAAAYDASNVLNLSPSFKNLTSQEVYVQSFAFSYYRNLASQKKFRLIPSKFRAYYSMDSDKQDNGYKISGNGQYDPKKKISIDYSLNVSTRYKIQDSSHSTQGFINLKAPKWSLCLGDSTYDLGSAIEQPNQAKGIKLGVDYGYLSFGSYITRAWNYQRNISDESKAKELVTQAKWQKEGLEISATFRQKQNNSNLFHPIKQAAFNQKYQSKFGRIDISHCLQFKSFMPSSTSSSKTSIHQKACSGTKIQVDLNQLPIALVSLHFQRGSFQFIGFSTDQRLLGINLSKKGYGLSNWSTSYDRSLLNVSKNRLLNSPCIQNFNHNWSCRFSDRLIFQASQTAFKQKDRFKIIASDYLMASSNLNLSFQILSNSNLAFSEQISYYRYYLSKFKRFPILTQRWSFSTSILQWLSSSIYFENSKNVSEESLEPNRLFGYSLCGSFSNASFNIGYQAAIPHLTRSKLLTTSLQLQLAYNWSLSFELQSRSRTSTRENDYRWNLYLEKSFELPVGEIKEPGCIYGSILAHAPARLPASSIISISGMQTITSHNNYKFDGLALGEHFIFLTNPVSGTLEKGIQPSKIELTRQNPRIKHNIEVLASSSVAGRLVFLKPVQKSSSLENYQNSSTKEWEEFPIDGIPLSLTCEETKEILIIKCDEKGRFNFHPLQPGRWFIKPLIDEKALAPERYEIMNYNSILDLLPGERSSIEIKARQKIRSLKIVK
jgi:hypothetical protein